MCRKNEVDCSFIKLVNVVFIKGFDVSILSTAMFEVSMKIQILDVDLKIHPKYTILIEFSQDATKAVF